MNSAEEQFHAAAEGALLFALPNQSLFQVEGADAVRYLQGRLTQNIKALPVGKAARSLLLTPQGRVQGQMLVVRLSEDFLLVHSDPLDADGKKLFTEALLQFKVADRLEVEDISDQFHFYSLQGRAADSLLAEVVKAELPRELFSVAQHSSLMIVRYPRAVGVGFDLFVRPQSAEEITQQLINAGAVSGSVEGWELLRIKSGIAQFGIDITEKTLGPELDVTDLVSFSKGCYAGQEVVERATARGKPSQRLHSFRARGMVAAPAEISYAAGGEVKKCGSITSSCYLAGVNESFALGFVKTSTPEAAELRVGDVPLEPLS